MKNGTYKNITLGLTGMIMALSTAAQAAVIATTSATDPVDAVLESYVSNDAGIGPRNQNVPIDDRTAGQSFTLNNKALTIDKVTVRLRFNRTMSAPLTTLQLAILKDTNDDGSFDTQVGSTFSYDFTAEVFTGNDYLTFEFDALDVTGGGKYAFETHFLEQHVSHDLIFNRSSSGNGYTEGTQLLGSVGTFPNTLNESGDGDLQFFIQGTSVAPEPSSLALLGLGAVLLMGKRRKLKLA